MSTTTAHEGRELATICTADDRRLQELKKTSTRPAAQLKPLTLITMSWLLAFERSTRTAVRDGASGKYPEGASSDDRKRSCVLSSGRTAASISSKKTLRTNQKAQRILSILTKVIAREKSSEQKILTKETDRLISFPDGEPQNRKPDFTNKERIKKKPSFFNLEMNQVQSSLFSIFC
jgi:hypothetical protein